jgi:GNAT superfamily N-acetyltransferase
MVCSQLPDAAPSLPSGCRWQTLVAGAMAEAVGALRGSPPSQRLAHAQRLAMSPVPYNGLAVVREADGATLACGQFAREAELAGIYDVFTDERARNQGLARALCQRLLSLAAKQGATVGYLQVEADNTPARRLYTSLGFADGYAYHYRVAPGAEG